jgi:hypothetical protein
VNEIDLNTLLPKYTRSGIDSSGPKENNTT